MCSKENYFNLSGGWVENVFQTLEVNFLSFFFCKFRVFHCKKIEGHYFTELVAGEMCNMYE